MGWIVGCDTGGTFTDVVAVSDSGEARIGKVPSTPPQFDLGVVESVTAVGIPFGEVELLLHGTTVTTNAVITKTGAASALVTTRGFRDVLEIRRANREELYDILWDPPPPLVPRRHRLEVDERIDYAGEVVTPLDETSARAAARKIRRSRTGIGGRLPPQRAHEPCPRAADPGDPARGAPRPCTSRSRPTSCPSRPSSSGRRPPSPTRTAHRF